MPEIEREPNRPETPATEHESLEAEGRRRSGDWLDTQHEYPVEGVGGEPVEPGLEHRSSPVTDSGEPNAPLGGSERPLRQPADEPPRDPLVEAADPPEPL